VTDQGSLTVEGSLVSSRLSTIVVDGTGQLSAQRAGQLDIQGTLLVWNNPAGIVHGTPLGDAQLDATANVPGSFTYTPASGTVLPVGQGQVLSVTFTPSDSTDYAGANAQVSINVLAGQTQLTPTLNLNPVNIVYGTALADSQLSGTATVTVNKQTVNVAGTFAYTSAAGTILNAGNGQSEAVTFTPNDTTGYAAVSGTVIVDVAKADQTISLTQAAPAGAVYGTSFTVAATASSGLAVAVTASGAASGSGSASVTMVSGTGTGTLTFSQAGDSNYNAASVVIETVSAQKADQAITVLQAAPASAVYSTSFTVVGTASSGLAVSIAAGGAASGSGTGTAYLTMTSGTGTATVTFSQAGDSDYNPASVVIESVSAQKATQTITIMQAAPASAVYGTTFTVAATASSGLPVTITGSGAASGSGTGTAVITISSATGTATITFSQAGNANYASATRTVTVQVIGPGVSVVGTELWYVGTSTTGGKANNQVQISPAGTSKTGRTGIVLNGTTWNQSFTAIRVFGYNGNDDIRIDSSLMVSTFITEGQRQRQHPGGQQQQHHRPR
jgi:hypothetical protein